MLLLGKNMMTQMNYVVFTKGTLMKWEVLDNNAFKMSTSMCVRAFVWHTHKRGKCSAGLLSSFQIYEPLLHTSATYFYCIYKYICSFLSCESSPFKNQYSPPFQIINYFKTINRMKIKVIHRTVLNSSEICINLILPAPYLHASNSGSALMEWTFIF